MDINKAIQSAIKHHQAGNLRQAESLYRKILKKQPNNADILHMLGVINSQLENFDSAIKFITKSLQFNENNAYAYYNLGNAFRRKKKLDDAIICYQKTLLLNPSFISAYYNLAGTYEEKTQLDDAIIYYQKALKLNAALPEAHCSLGNILKAKGKLNDAICCFQKALQISPAFFDAWNKMGIVHLDQGQLDDAEISFHNALKINPNLSDALFNLGNIFQIKGHMDEAAAYYKKALEIDPKDAEAYCNLGNVFREKGQLDESVQYYQKAIEIKPDLIEAYINLGTALYEEGKQDEAVMTQDKAIMVAPNNFRALFAKCLFQLPAIYSVQEDIEICRNRYCEALIKLRETISSQESQYVQAAAEAVGSQQPFHLSAQGFNDRELQKIYGELICKIMAHSYPQFANRPIMPRQMDGEPLRIGIVSGYFHEHSNWKIPIKGWIENIDKQRFSLFGYYTGKVKDKETTVAREYFKKFVEDIYHFDKFCQIIQDDSLHVLIYPEIGMDPMTVKLAAVRLAPIQCASWGNCDTSGLPTIDYYISSDLMEPRDADDHYTEKLVRLPNLSIYYTPLDVPNVELSRETFGLRSQSILYLCAHSLFTHLPQYDEVYPRIAQRVNDCQFLFISEKSNHLNKQFFSRLEQAFNKYSLDPSLYMVSLPRLSSGQYHAINCISDIRLDTIGWSGCNSTFEALACNLPVVTLPGALMRQRHSAAILAMMGVTETIASTLDEYIELAVRLGIDPEQRKQLSEKIAANKHRVYRDKTCITALEAFLKKAVEEQL